jgi:hypothetical protein
MWAVEIWVSYALLWVIKLNDKWRHQKIPKIVWMTWQGYWGICTNTQKRNWCGLSINPFLEKPSSGQNPFYVFQHNFTFSPNVHLNPRCHLQSVHLSFSSDEGRTLKCQTCQIFLGTKYQNGKNKIKIYQMTIKYTKWKLDRPNGRKIDQRAIKYTTVFHCIALKNGLKIYHLATLWSAAIYWGQFFKKCLAPKKAPRRIGANWAKPNIGETFHIQAQYFPVCRRKNDLKTGLWSQSYDFGICNCVVNAREVFFKFAENVFVFKTH